MAHTLYRQRNEKLITRFDELITSVITYNDVFDDLKRNKKDTQARTQFCCLSRSKKLPEKLY